MERGVFLAFEGIDASGKSTQARRVAQDRRALFTFEPGDTAIGADLRRWLLDGATNMSAETEALLMLADRAHHVRSVIEPALASGHSVVTDRFAASTLAYQGYGRGVNLESLAIATALAVGSCQPALTILLDTPVDVAVARRQPRSSDRFESAGRPFFEAVRQGFLELAHAGAASWLIVDGALSEHEVAEIIDSRLDEMEWPIVE
jgi:dTMP kinase